MTSTHLVRDTDPWLTIAAMAETNREGDVRDDTNWEPFWNPLWGATPGHPATGASR